VALAAIILSHPTAAAPTKEIRRILILNEVNPSYPGISIINQGIQAGLNGSPYHLEFYSEYMDTSLFPDPAVQQEFRDSYIRKYQNRKLDVIITVGPSPLKFMQEVHQRAFPGVPIVFCLPTLGVPGTPTLDSDFTGVENDMAPAETVGIALRLLPGTKNVVVVGGVSPIDREQLANIKKELKAYEGRVDISYLTDLAMPDLLERLRHLPSNTVVLLTSVGADAAGTSFKANESGPLVAGAANAPVFTLFDVYINHGEVGGYLSSLSEQGKVAGSMALRILQGQKPQDIPRVKGVNTYMFDWRALKRWGLQERNLPPGSIVINRERTIWELYKWYILGGVCLVIVQTLMIFGLLWARTRARKAETELMISYERLRMAIDAGRFVGWDYDLKSGQQRWFGNLQVALGISSHGSTAKIGDFGGRVHPEDRDLVSQAFADARQSRRPYIGEFRVHRDDGTVRWISARGKFYYAHNGAPERMLGLAVDITEVKLAEQQLRESQERLAGIVGSAMDAIIAVDEEQRIVLFNAAAEKMVGCTQDEALGTSIDRFIPERFRSEHEAHMRRFGASGVTTRHMGTPTALWAVRTNGQEFPMEASITHLESDGRKLFIVIIRDITERHRAEEAMADVGRRLIEAHEEERAWIARELHDDVNQRIALLAIELEQWNQEPRNFAVEFHDHISHIRQQLLDLGKDVQALSHRLHSSKLEYLGIVAAARSFCKELSEQQKVEIDFSHTNIPHSVPKEISLCVFRVLQEALQNAVKYSGVLHFTVELHGTAGEIQLTVSDLGLGFDPNEAINRRGLGLISMRERLQLVGGEISIQSQAGSGTTIYACVPFRSSSDSARAAG
jgi:PAS domain S-box-containing protein